MAVYQAQLGRFFMGRPIWRAGPQSVAGALSEMSQLHCCRIWRSGRQKPLGFVLNAGGTANKLATRPSPGTAFSLLCALIPRDYVGLAQFLRPYSHNALPENVSERRGTPPGLINVSRETLHTGTPREAALVASRRSSRLNLTPQWRNHSCGQCLSGRQSPLPSSPELRPLEQPP